MAGQSNNWTRPFNRFTDISFIMAVYRENYFSHMGFFVAAVLQFATGANSQQGWLATAHPALLIRPCLSQPEALQSGTEHKLPQWCSVFFSFATWHWEWKKKIISLLASWFCYINILYIAIPVTKVFCVDFHIETFDILITKWRIFFQFMHFIFCLSQR